MSTLSGNTSKGEKSKQKFRSLDINSLYKNSRGESTEKPAQKNSTNFIKHGMQILGRVPIARKAPANLPSLKSEHSESGAAVALVPPGSTGWGKQEQEVPNLPNSHQNGNIQEQVAAPVAQIPSQQPPPPPVIPPPNIISQHKPIHNAIPANATNNNKLWSTVMAGGPSDGGHPPAYQSPQFQHEFPSLSAGDGATGLGTRTNQYGVTATGGNQIGLSLRPQTEGSWSQGGQRIPDGAGKPASALQAAPPQVTGQVGPKPEMLPPQVRSVLPPFMYKNSFAQGTSANHSHSQQAPATVSTGGRRAMDNRPPRFQERDVAPEELTPRPIIREEELSKLDKVGHDMGWAASDDIDYNQKLAFSDDEGDRPPKKDTKNSMQPQFYSQAPPKTPDSKTERQTPPRQWNSPRNENYRGPQSDEEEFFAQKQKQYKEEVGLAIKRAKQRKEEEEKRFSEESKQRAQKKLLELDEKVREKRERNKEIVPDNATPDTQKSKDIQNEKSIPIVDSNPKATNEVHAKENTHDKVRDKPDRTKEPVAETINSEPPKEKEPSKVPVKHNLPHNYIPRGEPSRHGRGGSYYRGSRLGGLGKRIDGYGPPPTKSPFGHHEEKEKTQDDEKSGATNLTKKPNPTSSRKEETIERVTSDKHSDNKDSGRKQVNKSSSQRSGQNQSQGQERRGRYDRRDRKNPVNSLQSLPQTNKNHQSNPQNKLAPRFAKQKMQKQIQQQNMFKDDSDVGKPHQPVHSSSSMYGSIKTTPPVSSSLSSAWEKPLGSQLLAPETDTNNTLCIAMEGVELNTNSPTPAHGSSPGNEKAPSKPPAQIVDKNLLDGTTPPVNTIIFENTNYKSGPGGRNTLRNTTTAPMNLSNDKPRSKLEEDIENTVFRKTSITDLLQKGSESNSKTDTIQLSVFKEESDMKLDFFGSDLTQLTEDKVTKTLCNTKSITPVNSTICNADSLNMKIASVKKVWETTEQEADETTSLSFGGPVLDPVFKGNDGQDDVENYNGGSNQVPSTTNVCKVKPTQQVSNGAGQPVSSSSQQPHSAIGHPMLLNTPLSPPPIAGAPVGVSLGAQAYAANQHLANFQAAAGQGVATAGSAQFSISAIPSPPTVLYNSKQQIQSTGLYGAFMPATDQSGVLGGQGHARAGGFGQYQTAGTYHGLGQAATSYNTQSQQIQSTGLYGAFMPATDQSGVLGGQGHARAGGFGQYQTAGTHHGLGQAATSYNTQSVYLQTTPHPPPTGQAPPELFSSLNNFRLSATPFGQNQPLNNPTTMLISSTSNSLMSATVKPSSQPISAIGAQAGYYQQPGNSTMPSASQLPQHQAGYGLQGNVFGSHNQSNTGIQGYQSFLSTQMQVAALNVQNVPQQYRSSALPNPYHKEGQQRYPAPIQRPHNFPQSNPMNSMSNNGSNNQKHNRNNPNKSTNKYYGGQSNSFSTNQNEKKDNSKLTECDSAKVANSVSSNLQKDNTKEDNKVLKD